MQNLIAFLELLGITFSTYLKNATLCELLTNQANNVPTPKSINIDKFLLTTISVAFLIKEFTKFFNWLYEVQKVSIIILT